MALARVGLPHHAGRLWQDLSGGERQRVKLARVAAAGTGSDPFWLLRDEPVSSLGIAHRLSVRRLAGAGRWRSCTT
ncbi:MAG: hypothetical protein MEQ74_06480 [Paracoccus sp.]|nr:hypothetical protein [Paracoccus sp. (in: a-proteobacteria)]